MKPALESVLVPGIARTKSSPGFEKMCSCPPVKDAG